MWLRIVDIDFDAASVCVEVAPDETEDFFTRLDAFASKCVTEDLKNIRLHYRRGTSARNVSRLADFCSMKRFSPPKVGRPRDGASKPFVRFRSVPARRKKTTEHGNSSIRYLVRIDRIDRAVERLNRVVTLIGISEDLDARSTLLLRLCVYELTTNSVDHGNFSTPSPEISMVLSFEEDRVSVTYQDNAEEFLTTGAVSVNYVEEQISASRKRGLGLYLLNRLCSEFTYERENDWNVSNFFLDVNRLSEPVTKR